MASQDAENAKKLMVECKAINKKMAELVKNIQFKNNREKRDFTSDMEDAMNYMNDLLQTLKGDNEYRYEKYDGAEQLDKLKAKVSAAWHKEGSVKMKPLTAEEVKQKMGLAS